MATYTTTFPLTENPISESGNWICGDTVGLDWYDMLTASGIAQGENSPESYSDPCAILTGTWSADQMAEATVYSNNPSKDYEPEVELRLRNNLSAHVLTGYEICATVYKDKESYCVISRWNGDRGDIDILAEASGHPAYGVKNGDVFKATIVGDKISAYINDVLIVSYVDSSANKITSGNPGIGVNYGCDATYDDFGFTDFYAEDGIEEEDYPVLVGGLIAADADDGQFYYDGSWAFAGSGNEVYFGYYGSQPDITIFRFALAGAIPSDAIINSAILSCYGVANEDVVEFWACVAESSNAPQPTGAANRPTWAGSGGTTTYPTTREGAGAGHWTSYNWVLSASNELDIAGLIQHLVDTYGGLAGGAHINVYLCGDESENNQENGIEAREQGLLNPANLSIIYTAAGGATYNESITVFSTPVCSNSPKVDFFPSLGAFASTPALNRAVSADLLGSIGLASTPALNRAAIADLLGNIGLASTPAASMMGGMNYFNTLTLASTPAAVMAYFLGIFPSLVLSSNPALSPAALADFYSVLILASNPAASMIGGMDYSAALTLASSPAVNMAYLLGIFPSLVLSSNPTLAASAIGNFFNSLTLAGTPAAVMAAVTDLFVSLALASDPALAALGGSDFYESLALSSSPAFSIAVFKAAFGELALLSNPALSATALADLYAAVIMASAAGISLSALAELFAGLSLSSNPALSALGQIGGEIIQKMVAEILRLVSECPLLVGLISPRTVIISKTHNPFVLSFKTRLQTEEVLV